MGCCEGNSHLVSQSQGWYREGAPYILPNKWRPGVSSGSIGWVERGEPLGLGVKERPQQRGGVQLWASASHPHRTLSFGDWPRHSLPSGPLRGAPPSPCISQLRSLGSGPSVKPTSLGLLCERG